MTDALTAIFQGRRYRVTSQTTDGVSLQPLEKGTEGVWVSTGDRDLILNPNTEDLQLAAAYERGEISAFEYPDGHTYPPGRQIGARDDSDGPNSVH